MVGGWFEREREREREKGNFKKKYIKRFLFLAFRLRKML